MQKFMQDISYEFKNMDLLTTAFTHSSYANENNTQSYERLEFLGDSILSFIVSTQLFASKENILEGEMSKLRAAIVCEKSLDECAKKLNFGNYLILSKGEELTGGRNRASILADVFEALLAAIYIDSGFEEAEKFVLTQLGDAIEKARKGVPLYTDFKTELQEIVQGKGRKVSYIHVGEDGPAHCKTFTVQVFYNDKVISEASGNSKKEAEQNAARLAIKEVKNGEI